MKLITIFLAALLWLSPLNAAALPDRAAFFHAIERGDIPQARDWLDAGLPPDYEGNLVGTGLMIAAWEGNVAMMELFLSRGADINRSNSFGEQALLHAAWRGHLTAVRWLVERGATLNREGKAWAALHYAAFAGYTDIAAYLLERGADVNALSVNGSTPLMMAAREGKEEVATRLLGAGARTDIVNDNGENAVAWAMRNNNLTIARTISGSENFARAAAQPKADWGRAVRSQPVPDRVDMLLAQARKLEAAGRRDAALKVYRAALASLNKAKAATARKSPPRKLDGMVITARRGDPDAQSSSLNYATPAIDGEPMADAKVGAGTTASGREPPTARSSAAPTESVAKPDVVDELLKRARALEASGRRGEALQIYRQASAALRGGR